MKNIIKIIGVSTILLSCAVNASSLGFDDITTSSLDTMPGSYGGFDWDANFYLESNSRYQSKYGNSYGSTSGEYAIFNAFGNGSVSVSSSSLFDFTGASFTSWASGDAQQSFSATKIIIEGYREGALISSLEMDLSFDDYDWMQADLLDIDTLVFSGSGANSWWLMDDFTFNESRQAVNEDPSGTPYEEAEPMVPSELLATLTQNPPTQKIPAPSILLITATGLLALRRFSRK